MSNPSEISNKQDREVQSKADSTNESPYPQAGDEWEVRFPGKPKRVKIVERVGDVYGKRAGGKEGLYPYVHWYRLPKGRYSGLSVLLLMKHGRRLSTKAERDAHLESQIAKAKANREAERRNREAMKPCQQTNQQKP